MTPPSTTFRLALLCATLSGLLLHGFPAASAAQTLPEAQADQTAAPGLDETGPSIALKGSVWRAKPGIVFLKTPVGLLTLSSKTTLKDMRASQSVSFWIHGSNMVVEIRKRTDDSLVHRYLAGPVVKSSEDTKELVRWTPEGEASFHYGAHDAQLSALHGGDPITVEVDAGGTVIGLHDLQFDLQIGQVPPSGSDAHVLLSGTVSKLKSNFIFFRTPVGVINVNAKIGIKNAKVGQTMTLHVHHHSVVADLTPANGTAPIRRFITGPLEFSSPDHAEVKLWTPAGEQTFPADRGKSMLAGTKEGHTITVELTGDGTVVDFHHLNDQPSRPAP
ncbi:MAG: conserved exported protein of unknown function [Nitrospira sp.]|nr:MAG: conserved exported protein of unknown function [Nitrospira sp.]